MQTTFNMPHKNSLFFKLVAIGFLIGVSLIASFSVFGLGMERSSRADEAQDEIAAKWSRTQTLAGAIVTIPVRKTTILAGGQQSIQEDMIFLLPETLHYDASLEAETLSRGIFESAVYTGTITSTGSFNLDDIDLRNIDGIIQWNSAMVSIGIPDTRGIESITELMWNTQKSTFEPGVPAVIIGSSGISAPVQIQPSNRTYDFSFNLVLRGSREINFIPLGKTTGVTMSSNWPSPSFIGEFLPNNRNVTNDGFAAQWSVSSFGRSLPQSWVQASAANNQTIRDTIPKSAFGVSLLQEVDFYTQVTRAIKYSVLFITLTFLAFFMFEALSHLRIHPLNYLLVGLAIALFYLLLLSLSEYIGFLSAYSISTLFIAGLITAYSRSVLKAKKRAGIIAALLIALYSYLYVLLQLDELSLIFGSVFLFAILAGTMYLTRNINWYAFSEQEKS